MTVQSILKGITNFIGRYTSRKFLLVVGFIAAVILNKTQAWGLTAENLTLVFGIVAGFIGVEGAIDYKKLNNDATAFFETLQSILKDLQEVKKENRSLTNQLEVAKMINPAVKVEVNTTEAKEIS